MEKLLSIDEVAKMLHVAKSTIYSWACRDKLPCVRLSKRCLRFKESDILKWVAETANYPENEERPKARRKKAPARGTMADGYVEGLIDRAKRDVLKK